MGDFIIKDGILEKYEGFDSMVEIPAGITKIGEEAFRKNPAIVKVIIPEGTTHIMPWAFRDCLKLKEVIIPEGIESIGSRAFYWCESLESITIPDSVKFIGRAAFSSCKSLEKVVILSNNIRMMEKGHFNTVWWADGVFNESYGLKSAGPLNSGSNIEFVWKDSIPELAFYASALSEVQIPETIKSIGTLAFKGCRDDLNVTMPGKCDLGIKVFEKGVNIKLSTPVLSKDKLPRGLIEYINIDFFEKLTDEELAWIVLYQSKKWKSAVLSFVRGQKALDVLEKCYIILKDVKKITNAMGTVLADILYKANVNGPCIDAAAELKSFLIAKRCHEVAESIHIEQKAPEAQELEIEDNRDPIVLSGGSNCGDEIAFGRYPQEKSQKPIPIKWIVLGIDGDRMLVISKACLAIRPYHEIRKKVSWTKCDLRKWLNVDFLQAAFTDQEQKLIAGVRDDKVSLLTLKEINTYVTDINMLISRHTEYTCMDNPDESPDSLCSWWLCMPIGSEAKAPYVAGFDPEYCDCDIPQIVKYCVPVNQMLAVRPTLWLNMG